MHLLLVANFDADAGYAWDTIEAVLRRVGEKLVDDGHRVTVAYAQMPAGPSVRMRGAPFHFVEFDYNRVYTPGGLRAFIRLLRERNITTLYLTDRESWSPRYALYRHTGVRHIILHDRTSGLRTVRGRPTRALKRLLHTCSPIAADCYIAVSRFVQRRLIEANGTPAAATHLIYNGIDLSRFSAPQPTDVREHIAVRAGTPVVFCSGRVEDYKGFQTVVDAATLIRHWSQRELAFVLCGDGPYREALERRARRQGSDNFHFLGHRSDVPELLRSATIAVVPSLWHEAFGLTVVEAMAAAVPLIATRVGGIPELIENGRTGLLFEPGNAAMLARRIQELLDHPQIAARMADEAQAIVRKRFSLDRVSAELYAVIASLVIDTPLRLAASSGLRRTHAMLLTNNSRTRGTY